MDIIIDSINKDEALRYMGYKGSNMPEDIDFLIDDSIELIKNKAQAKYVLREFQIDNMKLVGTNFIMLGNDIRIMLKDCSKCYLICATLGIQVDNLIRTEKYRALEKSIVLDSVASAGIESICNKINRELIIKHRKQGEYLTDRFSPGYGDMPLEQQNHFCQIVESHRIGVNVSDSGLMIPRKTVTAIIGIASTPQTKRGGCESCSFFENCKIRKVGKNCEGL